MNKHKTGAIDIDDFVEELLLQAPALVTHEELADYKQRANQLIEQKCLESRIDELDKLQHVDDPHHIIVQERLAELTNKKKGDE